MKSIAALLLAPVAKNEVSNYLIIVQPSSKTNFWIPVDMYLKRLKV